MRQINRIVYLVTTGIITKVLNPGLTPEGFDRVEQLRLRLPPKQIARVICGKGRRHRDTAMAALGLTETELENVQYSAVAGTVESTDETPDQKDLRQLIELAANNTVVFLDPPAASTILEARPASAYHITVNQRGIRRTRYLTEKSRHPGHIKAAALHRAAA